MRYLVSGEEMKALDHYSIQKVGIPSMVLMERAALCVVEEIHRRREGRLRVRILCGSGNNGADGLAMARIMTHMGDRVTLQILGDPDHASEEWKTQMAICRSMEIPTVWENELTAEALDRETDVIVDALLGTGLSRNVKGRYEECIQALNQCSSYVAAVDIPSGISSDTGEVLGCAVRADLTVTFEYGKIGQVLFPGAEYAGEVVVRSIGILARGEKETPPSAFTAEAADLEGSIPRPASSNKGTFGKVLVIAGSRNMAGASLLAARAALRTGSGLVRVYAPECNREILQLGVPEAILTTHDEKEPDPAVLAEACCWASAIVIGPGLGRSAFAEKTVGYVLQQAPDRPVILDADALNILAEHPEWNRYLREDMVLTPHMGEMSRLCGIPIAAMKKNPVKAARIYAEHYGCTLVLKDARTVVARSGDPQVYINTTGNSGMSTGGSGDVLAGIIGSLLGQGLPVFPAAWQGVLLHGAAGDRAAQRKGERAMIAGDLVEALF